MVKVHYAGVWFYLNPQYIIWVKKDRTVFKGRERYKIKLSKQAGVGGYFSFKEDSLFFETLRHFSPPNVDST